VKALATQSHPWTEWPRWSAAWSQVHAAAAEASFFLTTDWVETWLDVFGPVLQPRILVFSEGDPAPPTSAAIPSTGATGLRAPSPANRYHKSRAVTTATAILIRKRDAVSAATGMRLTS
jgi:hypothetical protein